MHIDQLNYYTYEDDLPLAAGATFTSQLCSHDFCSRLHTAFKKAYRDEINIYGGKVSNYWDKNIVGNKRIDILKLMMVENYSKSLRYSLSNPIRHNLWYGFDDTAKRFFSDVCSVDAYRIYDVLLRFYEAIGGRAHQDEKRKPPLYIDVETLINEIETSLKVNLTFPAPYAKMMRIVNKRGLIRTRALWGLYLAWRANQMGAKNILELGGGLGYAAFYSSLFGANNYSIIDIPLTLVASGHFLSLTLGEESLNLYGEDHNTILNRSVPCKFN